MSHESEIHRVQTIILRELLFVKGGSFSDIRRNSELASDHFNFHISRLVELGYVAKESRGRYKLTNKGKEYANRLDTDENTIERQPKVAVLLGVVKPGNNATQYLFQKRVKIHTLDIGGSLPEKLAGEKQLFKQLSANS